MFTELQFPCHCNLNSHSSSSVPVPVCLFHLYIARLEFLHVALWPRATEVHICAQESSSASASSQQEYFAKLSFKELLGVQASTDICTGIIFWICPWRTQFHSNSISGARIRIMWGQQRNTHLLQEYLLFPFTFPSHRHFYFLFNDTNSRFAPLSTEQH